MFHMYDKKCVISVTSHALDPLPLSQIVTPSRTPSPSRVTYFMDQTTTPLAVFSVPMLEGFTAHNQMNMLFVF